VAIPPLAKTMLIVAYVRQFAGDEPLEWRAWAEEGGHDRGEASRAQEDLRCRNLATPAGGGRLRVTTTGVELIERGALVDADLVGSQYDLRRRILRALEDRRAAETAGGGASEPSRGLRAEQIAQAVEELVERVTPSLLVLRDRFLLQVVGDDPLSVRISQAGRSALPAVRQAWPLSPDLEGTGNRRPVKW
jgi:hypothetical protein